MSLLCLGKVVYLTLRGSSYTTQIYQMYFLSERGKA